MALNVKNVASPFGPAVPYWRVEQFEVKRERRKFAEVNDPAWGSREGAVERIPNSAHAHVYVVVALLCGYVSEEVAKQGFGPAEEERVEIVGAKAKEAYESIRRGKKPVSALAHVYDLAKAKIASLPGHRLEQFEDA
jgi:hypothetical protein